MPKEKLLSPKRLKLIIISAAAALALAGGWIAQDEGILGRYSSTSVSAETRSDLESPTACGTVAFASAVNFTAGAPPTGIAMGDFNSDGRPDLISSNASTSASMPGVSLRLSDGLGGFGAELNVGGGLGTESIAVGDFNTDGKLDFAAGITSGGGGPFVRFGDGAGGFASGTTYHAGHGPHSIVVADVNLDTKPDIVTANPVQDSVAIYLNDGSGGFSASPVIRTIADDPISVIVADFNGDNNPDLATANANSDNVSVQLGNGTGGFGATVSFAVGDDPRTLVKGDFNGDGNMDLATANRQSNTISILLGAGNGGFASAANITFGLGPQGLAAGDLDVDGDLDLAVSFALTPGTLGVLIGNGSGTFQPGPGIPNVGGNPVDLALSDLNLDLKPDIATANFGGSNISVLSNSCVTLATPTPTPSPSPSPTPSPSPGVVTWNRQALGQLRTFPCSSGTFNWPNNNNWSQQEVIAMDSGCNPPQPYVAQPSNWNTPTFPNGSGTNVLLTAATGPTNVNVQATLSSLTVQSGAGNMTMQASSFLDAQTYDFQTDGVVGNSGGGGSAPYLRIAGLFKKSAGGGLLDFTGGTSEIYLRLHGGTVQVDQGTLKLGRSVDTSTGANFVIAEGAAVDFNAAPGGAGGNYTGTYTGTGGGAFLVRGNYFNTVSPGATFNFAGDLFQWSGGTIGSGPSLVNNGTMNLVGADAKQIDGQAFHNAGLMTHSGTGNLQFGTNSFMFNDANGTYDLRSDAGFNPGGRFDNLGTFRKSGGTGVSSIGVPPGGETVFNHLGGTVEVQTGTLRLARGESTGGTIIVAQGAKLDLNSSSVSGSYSGTYNGSGGGIVEMNSGNINSSGSGAVFNLPNFHWNGGSISAGPPFNNAGTMRLQGSGGWGINGGGFSNSGTMIHSGTGQLQWGANAFMTIAPGGVYDIQRDGNITNRGNIRCSGTLRKSAGPGEATIGTPTEEASFRLLGCTVEVTSGTLKLGRSFPDSTGGNFIVGQGSVVDINGAAGFSSEWHGTYTGSGAGRLELNGGQLSILAPGATFDFEGDLFQWTGGSIFHASSDPFINAGTMNIAGQVQLHGHGMVNDGTLRGTGRLGLTGNPSSIVNNGTVSPGTSTTPGALEINLNNGDLQMNSGSMLDIAIGGTGTGYSRLNRTDNRVFTLGGTLQLRLINGFVPAPGDVFTIVTTNQPIAGRFANVPNGGRVNTTDGLGSFRVVHSGNNVVISDFGPAKKVRADFDGDGRTDVSVYRPSQGAWYIDRSTAGFTALQFGISTDVLTPGDYDGDEKTDIAVARLNTSPAPPDPPDFYVLNSATNTFSYPVWGNAGDVPVIADYDGDGKVDIAVWRPSNGTWYVINSGGGVTATAFGQEGDKPYPMDTDGDGKANLAYFRPSTGDWVVQNQTGGGSVMTNFGVGTDVPVPADYDGDSKDDIAVFRPSNGVWYIIRSRDAQVQIVQFGQDGDVPVPGDYDGDGLYDQAVFRGGAWYINRSTAGFFGTSFGLADDRPVPKAYIP